MRNKFIFLVVLLLSFALFCPKANAQNIELNTPQDILIFGPGFYPFSDSANESFKELLNENGSVAVIITDLGDNMLKVAPAADFREIGKKKKVTSDGTTVIKYKKKKAKKFGLSFVPSMNNITVGVEVQPFAGRPCPNPVNCQDDCGENLGKCCEKDANGNQKKICIQVGLSSCGCANR